MASQNGIIGEEYGLDLPVTQVTDPDLRPERHAAKFSRTKEFARLKEHLLARIEYYQQFLPDGRRVLQANPAELGAHWQVANAVTAELKMIIGFYEQAADVVATADGQ